MALPLPGKNQAYCDVSALDAGVLLLPLALVITNPASPDATSTIPTLSFLLQHSTSGRRLLFDLGTRKDWGNLPPKVVEIFEQHGPPVVDQDVFDSLSKGGTTPADIDTICLSHLHFDHIGDTRPFLNCTFVVGGGCRDLIRSGYPQNPESPFASDLLPEARTSFLDDSVKWEPIGPFPRAFDFYGDGSLYVVDAPGHLTGHINILARTSSDGAWIYIAGDSAHHWNLILGNSEIFVGHGGFCMHADKGIAEEHIRRIRALMKVPRVKVLLAHDEPWYESNKGGPAFWPGKIPSL